MGTRIYGRSDDLIDFEGDIHGEVGCYGTHEDDAQGVLLAIDDGTMAVIKYGKPGGGAIWSVTVLREGALFERLEICTDEDAEIYSDILHLKDGAKVAWASRAWERVK